MRKLVYACSLFLLCLFQQSLIGQTIQGKVLDENDQGMIAANVYLMTAADTTFIRGTMSNEEGRFIFEKLPAGSYIIQITSVGYNNIYTNTIKLSAKQSLQLDPIYPVAGLNLEEVVVVEERPLYQAEPDGLVVNVENSIVSAGATALEILERSPGVVVDRQNNTISLVGKQGVNVMINGKLSYMPISSLVQFLEGMS